MRLNNKVAIITGGARGIGFATAKKFLAEGAKVACFDVLEKELAGLEKALGAGPDRLRGYRVDVTRAASVKENFAKVEKDFGPVDILINNAGITRDAMLHKMDEASWDSVINVNLKGVFLCGQAAASAMRERGKGVIINTSSVVGLYGNVGQSNYAATKGGVITLTLTWAKELGPKGVRVNAVAPGFTATEMVLTVPEKVLSALKEKTPLRDLAKPEDIANAFCFLASDEAAFITGHVLAVDGGLVL